jgi:hypothetical protein
MAWSNKRWNSLKGPDAEVLRAIFKSLEDFLRSPTFEQGIEVGDAAVSPTVDVSTGVVTDPPTTHLDSAVLTEITIPPEDIAELEAALAALESTFPIEETDIADGAISTPKLQANSVTADQLAAVNIGVGKFIASTSYTPGTAGWAIQADGTAEFNDVTVRGTLVAGDGVITADDGFSMPTEKLDLADPDPEIGALPQKSVTFIGQDMTEPYGPDFEWGEIRGVQYLDGGVPSVWGHLLDRLEINSYGQIQLQAASNVVFRSSSLTWVDPADGASHHLTSAWTTYTPTYTNIGPFGPGRVSKYRRFGKTVNFRVMLPFEAFTTITGNVYIGLPVAADADGVQLVTAHLLNSGVREYLAVGVIDPGDDKVQILQNETAGTGNLSSTVPFTWGTGDTITVQGTYESA